MLSSMFLEDESPFGAAEVFWSLLLPVSTSDKYSHFLLMFLVC
nr:MAG TPA: hypothetical protein [Caudoviricetes sp.]